MSQPGNELSTSIPWQWHHFDSRWQIIQTLHVVCSDVSCLVLFNLSLNLLNLPLRHFWLDLSFWTLVESRSSSRNSCVRRLSSGLRAETFIAVSDSSSFTGSRMANLSVSDLILVVPMTWSDIGSLSVGALSPLSGLAGVTSIGLSLISSTLSSFLTSTFVVISWFSVFVASLQIRTSCSIK